MFLMVLRYKDGGDDRQGMAASPGQQSMQHLTVPPYNASSINHGLQASNTCQLIRPGSLASNTVSFTKMISKCLCELLHIPMCII